MTGLDFATVRAHTERLAAPLSAEDQTVQSMPDASPTKWHRAHTTWFFETFLLAALDPATPPFDPGFGYLFNSYYEAVGPRHARPERGMVTRPGIDEVAAYRRCVDEQVLDLIGRGRVGLEDPILQLGLHHEQQHQELVLMDIQHLLSRSPMRPAYGAPSARPVAEVAAMGWRRGGGTVCIGDEGDGFAFDNEGPHHAALLAPYELADRLVTGAEWCAFIDDGGYERADLWMSDGWALNRAESWTAPLYWEHHDDGWRRFGLSGLAAVDPAAPVVNVSWYEADAFARWAGVRLPTEEEWEASAPEPPAPAPVPDAVPTPRPHGLGSDPGQWYGEAWQWTASAYRPYPGYRAAPGAVGEYNGKFMVNQHVLRGSSCLTPPGHARRTYRNFFPPSARWVCAGVRLARDLP